MKNKFYVIFFFLFIIIIGLIITIIIIIIPPNNKLWTMRGGDGEDYLLLRNGIHTKGTGIGDDYLLYHNGIHIPETDYLSAWNQYLSWVEPYHFNTVRLSFSFSDCPPNPDTGIQTHSVFNYTKMDQILSLLDSHGYQAVLDLHNWRDFYQYLGSSNWEDNWKDVATYYMGDDRILGFELFNEPYNEDFGLLDEQTYMWDPSIISKDDLVWAYANLTDQIREIDPLRIVIWADPKDYLQENPDSLLPEGSSRENIMFAWHNWGHWNTTIENDLEANLAYLQEKIDRMLWWQEQYPETTQWLGEFGMRVPPEYSIEPQKARVLKMMNTCLENNWGFILWQLFWKPGLVLEYSYVDTLYVLEEESNYRDTDYISAWNELMKIIEPWDLNTIRLCFSFSDCLPNPDTGYQTHSVLNYTKIYLKMNICKNFNSLHKQSFSFK